MEPAKKEVIDTGRGRRRTITTADSIELWRGYKVGESIHGIGRELSRGSSSVNRVLRCTLLGSIPRVLIAPRISIGLPIRITRILIALMLGTVSERLRFA